MNRRMKLKRERTQKFRALKKFNLYLSSIGDELSAIRTLFSAIKTLFFDKVFGIPKGE